MKEKQAQPVSLTCMLESIETSVPVPLHKLAMVRVAVAGHRGRPSPEVWGCGESKRCFSRGGERDAGTVCQSRAASFGAR